MPPRVGPRLKPRRAERDGPLRPAGRPRVRLIVTASADETPKSDSAERCEVEPGRGAAARRYTAPVLCVRFYLSSESRNGPP